VSVGSRRKARALALQVLYALDVQASTDPSGGGAVGDAVASYGDRFELDVDEPAREFAGVLARAAAEHRGAIDDRIAGASRNWRIERMARVDRNILRLAVGELLHVPETPVRVVINEAVELAKRFGTAESPAFVNGVLDRVAQALGRRDGEGGEPPAPAGEPGNQPGGEPPDGDDQAGDPG